MPKKISCSDFQKEKEYKMWKLLYETGQSLDLSGVNFIGSKESGSGVYWEPFLLLLFKFGNILKQTSKLKEIKMDWIRPLNYLESQSNEHVVYDNEHYIVDKGAMSNAVNARYAFQHLLDSINTFENLSEQTFQKDYKTLHSDSSYFFKQLNIFVKDGFRALHENIKLILKPLRMLRKSAYRLFSMEMIECKNEDLTVFEDKKDMKKFLQNIRTYMESEEYKMKRDSDINKIEDVFGNGLTRKYYEYTFENKIREDEASIEKEQLTEQQKLEEKEKDKKRDRGKSKPKKTVSPEEINRIKNEEEKKQLKLINIGNLGQRPPNRFMKEALQKDFEIGLDVMLKHLNKKVAHQFPFEIEAHKIFVNLKYIPDGRKSPQTNFYISKLDSYLLELKIKLYEMKLNGLSRILIPISLNIDLIEIIKKLYDVHNVIDRIMGDKLLHEQYSFIYTQINFLMDSNIREELEVYKAKDLVEECIPRYIFYESMRHSARVLQKMMSNSRKEGGHFSIESYYQPTKHILDSEDNLVINCFELKESLKKALTEELNQKNEIIWKEIGLFGRFWLMEGYFPPEDKDKWIDAIIQLTNIK